MQTEIKHTCYLTLSLIVFCLFACFSNAEGEEHLRQRRLQLPFSLTTGEAVLYDTFPTFDVMNPEVNEKKPAVQNEIDRKALDPSSILASMQRQDKSIYHQPTESELTVDDAFMDSWALFNVPSQNLENKAMKEEDTVTSVFDALEQVAQDGDLCSALQQMEVDSSELKEWENVLLKMAQESSSNDKSLSLDEILTNDIFSYVEEALYKEISKSPVAQPNATKTNPCRGQSGQYANSGYGFSMGHSGVVKSDLNKLDFFGMAGQEMGVMVNAAENSQRLSHLSPDAITGPQGMPGLQEEMCLQNILNPLSHSEQTGLFTFGSKGPDNKLFTQTQKHFGQKTAPSTLSGWQLQQNGSCLANQTENPQNLHCLQNGFHQQSQPTVNHWNKMVSTTGNHSPSLSSCKNCWSSDISPSCPNLPRCNQQRQIQPSQHWQQALPEQSCPGTVKNRLVHESYQNLETPECPHVGFLPETSLSSSDKCKNMTSDAYHLPRDRLAANNCSPLSSCMFERHSPLSTNADQLQPQAQAVSIASCSKKTIPNNQSPPQASCYFQWMHNEPVVGTSSIPQEDACISPPSCHMAPGIAPTNNQSVFQQYHGCNGQKQVRK